MLRNEGNTFDIMLNTTLDEDTSDILIPILTSSINTNMQSMTVALEHVSFMNSMETITQFNDQVHFVEGATAFTVSLTRQQYTASTLAVELKAKMDAVLVGGAIGVAYNGVTQKYTITTNTETIRFVDGPRNAYQVLGITKEDRAQTIPSSSSATFSGIVDVSGAKILIIECPELGDRSISRRDTIFMKQIPITAPFGVMNVFHTHTPVFKRIRMESIKSITLRLRDEHGNPFVLLKNTPIYVNLLAQKVYS